MRAKLLRFGWPAVYVAIAVGFLGLVGRYHHSIYGFTSFFQLDAAEERKMLPAMHELPVYVYRDAGGYDGMFYAQLSLSPTLRDPALPVAMDSFAYRARRMLGSWIAWLVGAGDNERALDAYALLNPACWLVLAILLLGIFPPRSAHDAVAWSGLLLSAGVLCSVRLALTDLPALVLVVAAMLALQRGRNGWATGLLATAALARETVLSAGFALVDKKLGRSAARLALVGLPLLAWCGYVWRVAGPNEPGIGNFAWPGTALLEKWSACLGDFPNRQYPWVPWLTLATLIGTTVQLVWILARPQWGNIWWRAAAGYALLALCLGAAPWAGYPGAAARVLLVLHLAFNVLVPRTRWGLVLLVAGNLSLFCGLEQMLNVPLDQQELAAARLDGTSYFVRPGEGCHGLEHRGSHRWCWTDGHATIRVLSVSQPAVATVHVSFNLTGFFPQKVTVQRGATVLWSGLVTGKHVVVDLAVTGVTPAGVNLVLTSARPPRLESAEANARRIAFAIGDVRISR